MDCASCEISQWRDKTQCYNKTYHIHKMDNPLMRNEGNDGKVLLKGLLKKDSEEKLQEKNNTLQKFEENMIANTFKYTPEPITILINFGINDKHFLYSSDNYIHNCSDEQVWDPFSEKCLTVYCNANYNLEDIHCNRDFTEGAFEEDPAPISSDLQLNFTVYIQYMENVNDSDVTYLLRSNFSRAFAHKFLIDVDRVSNVSVAYCGIRNFTSRFVRIQK